MLAFDFSATFKKPSRKELLVKSLKHPSVLLLIGANLVPLIGVLFFKWDIFSIMLLYWLESGVVGFLNQVLSNFIMQVTQATRMILIPHIRGLELQITLLFLLEPMTQDGS